MKNLFSIIPFEFFKPLTGKYKREYADCILLLYNTYKPEISYGVNRETVVNTLTDYFETDDKEMIFDNEEVLVRDARDKANGVIAMLKNCGWLEYEQEINHQLNVILAEYSVPIIESMNKVIKEEEMEYQGIISQIHASLQNKELYSKPYELILKGVSENTERLISELKRLNVSIKRHMEKQTNEMTASEVLDLFFEYHQNIGSKSYLRMKTSENVSYFRTSIIEKLEEFLEDSEIMKRAVNGYMEIEQVLDSEEAYDDIVAIILDVKSAFYRLDEIVAEIDRKHTKYQRSAVMRAKFLLSTGSNVEGKISKILNSLVEELNQSENADLSDDILEELQSIISIYPQSFLSVESLKTIPMIRKKGQVDDLREGLLMSPEERLLHKEALREKNRRRYSRKNIDTYVSGLLRDCESINVSMLPIESKRDLIRIIYISIYAGNSANSYKVKRNGGRVKINGYEFPDFTIMKR